MAKRNYKNKNKKQKGGGCCNPQVDVTRYTRACGANNQLPLDGLFMKHFPQSGGNIRAGTEVRPYISAQKGAGKRRTKKHSQKGKGYTILPDVNIGNRPQVVGYPDWAPPVVTSKGMLFSDNMKPMCGQQIGGKNKKSKRSLRKMRKNRKQMKGGSKKRTLRRSNRSKSKRLSKSKRSLKSKSKRSTRRKQRGGVVKGMSGVDSNFSGDMSTREFGCRQPMWKPNCV
jgi:hypothetical protein